jgi:hypothetical protein
MLDALKRAREPIKYRTGRQAVKRMLPGRQRIRREVKISDEEGRIQRLLWGGLWEGLE